MGMSNNVAQRFHAAAAQHPERLAVTFRQHDGWRSWSYSRLEARAREIGARLAAAGVGRADAVALMAPRHPDAIAPSLPARDPG